MPGREHLIVCDLGTVEYGAAWDLQRRVQGRLIEAKRSDPPRSIPHVMLLMEHPPVFTLGKSGDPSNLLASEDLLRQRGASFYHIDRGGDITFHGPGQIVGYPILDLNRFFTD
ncbi:MAG: lipoyl(octanoyl) transferase, partial [Rhodothermales bacterium]